MTEYARLVMVVDSTSAKKATDDLRDLGSQASKTESTVSTLTNALKPLASAFAALKVGQLIQESTLLAARYDQLGLVMGVVGRNVGLSSRSLGELQAQLEKTGISAIQSRNNIIKMIGANIDLSKATQLARLAQDAAVIGNTNSSEAFERLIRGIQSAEKETLETLGLNVNFQQSYEALAKQLGKSADQLTTVEKTQAAVTAALEAGKNIAGAYEASLGNANKQLQSASRYLENFQVKLGAAFQPQFAAGVTAYSDSLKFLNENVDGVVQVLETGLYLAVGRATAALVQKAGATALAAKETHTSLLIEAEAAAGALRTAEANRIAAKTELDRAAADVAAAEASIGADRQMQASEVARLRSVQAALAAELELEQVRLKAQISEQGRAATVARMAEIRLSEVAIIKQVEAAERSLAATTVATSEAVQAAQAKKTAAVAAYGEATLAVNSAVVASERAATSANAASRAVGGLATAGRGLLGILGGPAGLAIIAGAVALSFVDLGSKTDDLEAALTELAKPAKQIREEFEKLNNDQQQASITRWKDAQRQAVQEVDDQYRALFATIRQATVDPAKVRTGDYSRQLQTYQDIAERLKEARSSGQALSPILQEVGSKLGLPQSVVDGWVKQAGAIGDADDKSKQISDTLKDLTAETQRNTTATQQNNAAKAGMSDAGQTYVESLRKQLAGLQDNGDAVKISERWIREHADATDADKAAVISYGHAIAEQTEANKKASEAEKQSGKDSKHSADEKKRAAEQLLKSYQSTELSLSQQVALFGKTGEAAKLAFELQYGELSKLNEQQKDRLLGLAKEFDAKSDLVEQDKLRLQILRETGQVRAADELQFELDYAEKMAQYEKDGNTAALARLKTLKAIQDANREADVKPGTVEGVTKAPHTSGVDADVGGASSEMIKLDEEAKALQDWRDTELKKQLEYLDARAINEEEYSKRVANIHQQSADEQRAIDAAKNQALMAGGESLFGNLAGLAKEFAGEQSGLYKAMFAVQKAFAIAQTIVNTETASAAALAPPPIGLGPVAGAPYSQVIRAMGYTSAALIGATAISGMAHDGIDNIPKEGTWLLDRGERVVDRRTNGDLKDFLNRQGNTSTTTNSKTNNISLNVYGITDAKGMQESTARLARRISSAVSKSDRYV